MKLRRVDFPLLISLLLLVLFIFPLKSESYDDHNEQDKEDESDNDDETRSSGDHNEQDNDDESDNDDGKESHEDASQEDNENESENDSVTTDNNATNGIDGMPAMTTVQAKPDGMEKAQSGQDIQLETDVAVKVGVPVALIGLLILLGVIRLVYSGQLKDRVLEQGKIFARIPEDSIPIYVANGLSSGKATTETFANRTYASQDWPGEQLSGNKSIAGNEYHNRDQGIYLCDNASQAGTNYSDRHDYEEIDLKIPSNDHNTTYQTIDEGRAGTY